MMKTILKSFVILSILFCTFLPDVEVEASTFKRIKEERILLSETNGEDITVGLTSYKNEFGSLEVRIDAAGLPKLLDRFNPTIAYGRDLNDDQKIDTWFLMNHLNLWIGF